MPHHAGHDAEGGRDLCRSTTHIECGRGVDRMGIHTSPRPSPIRSWDRNINSRRRSTRLRRQSASTHARNARSTSTHSGCLAQENARKTAGRDAEKGASVYSWTRMRTAGQQQSRTQQRVQRQTQPRRKIAHPPAEDRRARLRSWSMPLP